MKNMKKVLAALLALTMTVCLASCGETGGNDNAGGTAENSKVEDSKTEKKEESKAEEKEEESKAEETEAVTEAAEDTSTGLYEMEKFSGEHEPYKIKFDFGLPKLAGYEIKPSLTDNTYFNYGIENSYSYKSEADDNYGIRATLTTNIYDAETIEGAFRKKEEQKIDKTDNNYELQYYIDEKDGKDDRGKQFTAHAAVYGESYLDACIVQEIRIETYESYLSKDELENITLAVANSVKFTEWDEKAMLTDDGGYYAYQHHLTVPGKVTIAGKEYTPQITTQGFCPLIYVDVIEDTTLYRVYLDTFLLSETSYENDKDKEKYTPVTVAGYDARYAIEKTSAQGEIFVKLSDKHSEKIKIDIPSMANGQMSMDGKSFFDVRKELTEDAAGTQEKYIALATDFLNACILDAE